MAMKRSITSAIVTIVTTTLMVVLPLCKEVPANSAQAEVKEVAVVTHVAEEPAPAPVQPEHKPEPQPEQKREEELPSRGSERSYKLNVQITAYTAFESGDTGLAYDGRPAIEYHTMAVDPRVIPFGSKVHVPGLGWFLAHDTGGAIKGHKVDVRLSTSSEADEWGRRALEVTVTPPTEKYKMAWEH